MIKLAVFLGNPGSKYEHNRHNAGRMVAKTLSIYPSLSWQKKFKGLYSSYEVELSAGFLGEAKVHFLMPETYMNLSGESALAAASFYKIKAEEIIVVHDELELPLGTVSLKFSGGLGGHNGLRSMKKCFNSADFWRLRIGIGRPVISSVEIIDWVLSDFTSDETDRLMPVFNESANLIKQIFSCDPESLLPEWKKKNILTQRRSDAEESHERI